MERKSKSYFPILSRYLISDFMLAVVLECFQEERERLDHLKLAYNHYMNFLTNCLRYGLIPKDTLEHGELSRYFLEDKDSDEIKEERFEKWLKNVPRDLKIDRMKRIILLRSITVDQFKSDPTDEEGGEEEESDLYNDKWTDWIVCCVLMTLDKVGLLLREVELIEAGQNPEKIESSIPAALNIDDKLTKVERPFKLVKDRKQIASDAFKYGHSLPTMTIDEYLSLERKRGNIIEGGGAGSAIKREIDEDNEGEMEIELLKARAFDEIKDSTKHSVLLSYH